MKTQFKVLSIIATGYGAYRLITTMRTGIVMHILLPIIYSWHAKAFGLTRPFRDNAEADFVQMNYIVICIATAFTLTAGIIGIVWMNKSKAWMLVLSAVCMAIGTLTRSIFNFGVSIPHTIASYAEEMPQMQGYTPNAFSRLLNSMGSLSVLHTIGIEIIWIGVSIWFITLAVLLLKKGQDSV